MNAPHLKRLPDAAGYVCATHKYFPSLPATTTVEGAHATAAAATTDDAAGAFGSLPQRSSSVASLRESPWQRKTGSAEA